MYSASINSKLIMPIDADIKCLHQLTHFHETDSVYVYIYVYICIYISIYYTCMLGTKHYKWYSPFIFASRTWPVMTPLSRVLTPGVPLAQLPHPNSCRYECVSV